MEAARKLCARVGVLEKGFLAEIIDFSNCTTASSKIGKYLFAEGGEYNAGNNRIFSPNTYGFI